MLYLTMSDLADWIGKVHKYPGRTKKPKKTEVVVRLAKNIGAIQISNELTLIERKIMNLVLLNALTIEKDELFHSQKTMVKDERTFYQIDLEYIEQALEWDKHSHRDRIKKSFRNLVETSLRFNVLGKQKTDGGKWNVTASLLSAIITNDDDGENSNIIYYCFSDPIKDVIITPTLYGSLNIEIQKHIDSKYALALWEYLKGEISITGQTAYLTEYVAIENYTELIAGSHSEYKVFKDINRFLIKDPLETLNTKTDLKAEVEYKKTGKKVTDLRFRVTNGGIEMQYSAPRPSQAELFDKQDQNLTQNARPDGVQEYLTQKINALLIKHKISQKKRDELLTKYSPTHIEANVQFILFDETYKANTNKAPLIIKAIEDNYANFGSDGQQERFAAISKLIWELKSIINPFDKQSRNFLRNLIQDYQISKDRRKKEDIDYAKQKLKIGIENFNNIMAKLNGLSVPQQLILKDIGFETELQMWQTLFTSKEAFDSIQQELNS